MDPIDPTVYEYRTPRFVGSRRVRCSLEEGALVLDVEGKRHLSMAYHDITAVRLLARSHGTNEALGRIREFCCRVIGGGQVVEITNCSNPGVGHLYRYENRAFNAFVRELHRRLLPFRSGVKFRTGHALYYWLAVVAAIVCAIYAPGKIDSEYHGLERSSHHIYNWVAAAGFAYAARRLRPRSYPPEDIPKKILPPEKDHRTLMQQW
jgi:hypothetical protein